MLTNLSNNNFFRRNKLTQSLLIAITVGTFQVSFADSNKDILNNTAEAGVAPVTTESKTVPFKSQFYEVVSQNSDGTEKTFNYRSNSKARVKTPYSFEEVRDLSAPALSSLLLTNEEGKTAEELIQEEYEKSSNDGREQAILLEGMKFGSQSALFERSHKYQSLLNDNKHELSRIFNFHPLLMMGGRVIPPVVVESDNLSMIEDRYTKRHVKKSYKIIEQARVVNTPLDWRTYLLFDVPKPIVPSKYALPIKGNTREEQIWANGVAQGWEAGLKQANDIMLQNIRTLERDYVGMIRFKIMLAKGMVTSPIPSNTKLGVTGDVDTLNIGESIFQVVEAPTWNKNAETWLALPQIKSPIQVEKFNK